MKNDLPICPLCGLELVVVDYRGKNPSLLALMERDDFCCFKGCLRVKLHDKVVGGVNYRGKVYCVAVFHPKSVVERERREAM